MRSFDDGFWSGNQQLCQQVEDAIFRLMHTVGVLAQYEKFERGTADGRCWIMQGQAKPDTDATEAREWIPKQAHGRDVIEHIQILGQEMDIKKGTRRNSVRRIAECRSLLQSISALAESNKRLVPAAALERLRGQCVFITDTAKARRSLLHELTKCIKAKAPGKAFGDGRKRAVKMAIAQGAKPSDGGGQFLWKQWSFGGLIALSAAAEQDAQALLRDAEQFNSCVWHPRTSAPRRRNIVYVMLDSAGKATDDEQTTRAGAAWVWKHGDKHVHVLREAWTEAELNSMNSTHQETINGVKITTKVVDMFPTAEVIIEVYDSQPAMFILRRLGARLEGLGPWLKIRADLLQSARGIRFVTLWNDRETGWIADLLTKYKDKQAGEEITKIFPDVSILWKED